MKTEKKERARRKARVLLDANFLMIPGQFGVDVFSEISRICDFAYELATVKEVPKELLRLAESGSGKDERSARMALQMLKRYGVRTLKYRKVFKSADDAILFIADRNDAVATQDRILRRKLKEKGIRLIGLRQKQYLKISGE